MIRTGTWMACWLAFTITITVGGSLAHADIYYVNAAGLGGEPDYEQHFLAQAADLDRIAKGGGATAHVVTLSGAQATRDHLQQALADVAAQAHADDVLIVHARGTWLL